MNAVLELLLRNADEDAEAHIRAAAYRAGLLWHCTDCRTDNPGDMGCQQCNMPPPDGTPEAPELYVVPVISVSTATTVAVYDDDEEGAEAIVEWINSAHGTDLIATGNPVPYNARPSERLLQHIDDLVTGHHGSSAETTSQVVQGLNGGRNDA